MQYFPLKTYQTNKTIVFFCCFILHLLPKLRPVFALQCTKRPCQTAPYVKSWQRHWSFKYNKPKYMDVLFKRMDFHTPFFSSRCYNTIPYYFKHSEASGAEPEISLRGQVERHRRRGSGVRRGHPFPWEGLGEEACLYQEKFLVFDREIKTYFSGLSATKLKNFMFIINSCKTAHGMHIDVMKRTKQVN
jgi:hypothetical protein